MDVLRQRTVVLYAASLVSGLASVMIALTTAVERRRRRKLTARGQHLLEAATTSTLYAVVGDAFVDILASGVDALPEWNSDCLAGAPIQLSSGGSAMNTALHLRQLSAMPIELHTAVGNDDFGRFLTQTAEQRGVTMVNHAKANLATGSCIVISGERDRTFITYRGAVDAFCTRNVEVNSSHVHVAGYYNCTSLQRDVADLLTRARLSGATSSLGVQHDATGEWGGIGRPPLTSDEARPDFLILSEDEASMIIHKLTGDATAWPEASALALLSAKAANCVVLTVGAKGAILATHKQDTHVLLKQPAAPVHHFVDATGAGDAFTAGFLHGLSCSKGSLNAALRMGCAAGATCVANVGASAQLDRTILAEALATLTPSKNGGDLYFSQD